MENYEEKYKQALERAREEETPISKGSDYYHGAKESMEKHLQFIDSLPEESGCEVNFTTKSDDLEREIGRYTTNCLLGKRNHSTGVYHLTQRNCDDIARHFAEWQKQKDLEDLFKSDMTMPNKFYEKGKADAINEKKEALQTEYEKGRFDMREEMMKDAVEGTVKYEIGSAEIPQCDRRYQVLSDPTPIANAKLGDKVKIIIVKE